MADIKVFYFDGIRGRGEFIRMILAAAGEKFEDVQIKLDSWRKDASYKKESPYGQLPYVIYKGKKYGQSIAIASYLAKKYGFYGTSAEDALKQEQVMHLVEDLRVPHVRDHFFAEGDKKAEMGKQLKEELFPRYLRYFETMLEENGDKGLFVGDSVTLADMYMYDFLETVIGIHAEALKDFCLLQKLFGIVKNLPSLKDYLANRPKTAI